MNRAIGSVVLAITTVAGLKFDTPAGWVSKPPASSMRIVEYTLPKTGTDAEDAALAVYFFGSTQGGTVQANLDRWLGQVTQPNGKPTKDVAKTTTLETKSGLKVTLLDVSGTYVAEVAPGATERFNKPGFRMRAAVIETAGGPYFVKLVGPAATVAKWDDSFLTFLKSARAE